MTAEDRVLVQRSFEKVAPNADQAAAMFYARLFELDPETKRLFTKTDMSEQGRKLMQVIGIAVRGLDDLDALVPVVRDLGKRHVGYGVRRKDYDTVGAALIETLERGLGPDFTPDVREAWTKTYALLANAMIETAEGIAI